VSPHEKDDLILCMEKDPKWHLMDCAIFSKQIVFCFLLRKKENLTWDQELLRAFIHSPLLFIFANFSKLEFPDGWENVFYNKTKIFWGVDNLFSGAIKSFFLVSFLLLGLSTSYLHESLIRQVQCTFGMSHKA